ncbi:MAG: nucleotidyltransferase family protein [bacterium]
MPPENTPMIAGLILAAGKSTRFGAPKLLTEIGGTTLIAHAVGEIAKALGHDQPIWIVTGGHAEKLEAALRDKNTTFCPAFAGGIGCSIAWGVRHIREDCNPDAILVTLADQPALVDSDYAKLVTAFNCNGLASAAAFGEPSRIGAPAIFPKVYFDELMQLSGDQGARKLLRNRPADQINAVPIPNAAVDIDTPEDLAGFIRARR